MIINRYLTDAVIQDLKEKMVFVGGARQVGKTTMSNKLIAKRFKSWAYYNWDNRTARKQILNSDWPGNAELIILDEIHKYKNWKRLIKGEWDTVGDRYKFLITGSARLDLYRRGGDSLQGRYHYYRLHPFSLAELLNKKNQIRINKELNIDNLSAVHEMDMLDIFGGFPEPLIKQDHRSLRRWHNEKNNRLFREDIREIEFVRDLSDMMLLSDLLPQKVGSLLSVNSIREDLEVSYKAVLNWISILESFYYCFRIYPFTGKGIRSIKKTPKLYLWDWSEINEESPRFENMIASHLLKLVHFLYDYEGYRTGIYFLRDVDKREVDFIVTEKEKPWFALEVKLNDTNPSRRLKYFGDRLNIPYLYQVVKTKNIDRFNSGIRVVSADKFLAALI